MMPDQYDPHVLARYLDDEAKGFWGISLFLGGFVFVIGLLGIFNPYMSNGAAYLCSVMTLLSFIFNLAFESSRGKAQELRRKLDLLDSFGWAIPDGTCSDILLRCSKIVKMQAKGKHLEHPYFASTEPVGAKRALQNVRESAWWSEHLAEKMFKRVAWATGIIVLGALTASITTLAMVPMQLHKDLTVYSNIARAVTSLLMLIFSLNLVKLTISYYKFSKESARCKDAASAQLTKTGKGLDNAIVTMYEYFLIRSTSPVLPTWLWSRHRDELNALYPHKETPERSSSVTTNTQGGEGSNQAVRE
jgi:hypothetical protein